MSRTLQIINRTRTTVVVANGELAENLWTRFRGLMGKRSLPDGYGLLFQKESAIHSFGMRIPIDVVYLDRRGIVLHLTHAMPPARLGPLVRHVQDVLELPVGTLERTQTRVGDQFEIKIL